MDTQPVIKMNSLQVFLGYEFEQENCQICRSNLSAPPLSELTNNSQTKIDMTVLVGKCGHMFHKKCINEMKKNNFTSCPQCNLVWNEEDALSCEVGFQQ
jgi:hypothetical protein